MKMGKIVLATTGQEGEKTSWWKATVGNYCVCVISGSTLVSALFGNLWANAISPGVGPSKLKAKAWGLLSQTFSELMRKRQGRFGWMCCTKESRNCSLSPCEPSPPEKSVVGGSIYCAPIWEKELWFEECCWPFPTPPSECASPHSQISHARCFLFCCLCDKLMWGRQDVVLVFLWLVVWSNSEVKY